VSPTAPLRAGVARAKASGTKSGKAFGRPRVPAETEQRIRDAPSDSWEARIWALPIPIYARSIWYQPRRLKRPSGIYRTWPKDRVELRDGKPTLDNPARIERLRGHGMGTVGWAAYFSLLSTFQIGFREFSVGNWLARAQPRNFVLEPAGWVRTVSGFQSLLCVYLLAMWVLTYFGRSFQ